VRPPRFPRNKLSTITRIMTEGVERRDARRRCRPCDPPRSSSAIFCIASPLPPSRRNNAGETPPRHPGISPFFIATPLPLCVPSSFFPYLSNELNRPTRYPDPSLRILASSQSWIASRNNKANRVFEQEAAEDRKNEKAIWVWGQFRP